MSWLLGARAPPSMAALVPTDWRALPPLGWTAASGPPPRPAYWELLGEELLLRT